MGLSRVQIQIIPKQQFPQNVNMVMSRALATKLDIRTHPFWVAFGSATQKGTVAFNPIHSNLIRISSELSSQLHLSNQSSIFAEYNPESLQLRFGTLFGILINMEAQENPDPIFGLMTRFLEECANSAHLFGIQVAIFEPKDIQIEDKCIQAWIREKGKWIVSKIPFPDVIYNRITSRKVEQEESLQKKLEVLKTTYKIPIFNENFLDKHQVHLLLMKDHKTLTMLPETYVFHPNRLRELLLRYPTVYLKPNNGSLGNGIIRITKEHGRWVYESSTPNGTNTRNIRSISELSKILTRRIGSQSYLIQQGLNLIKLQGRPLDFRVLVQKNRAKEWQITSIVGRIANDQNIVSNLAQGGSVRKAIDVLKELEGIPNTPTIKDIRDLSYNITKAFEVLAEGHFAELGIDLAIDTSGKVWLLEINSKPSKTDDTVTNPTLTTRPSVTRLLEYVTSLTGLYQKKNHSPPATTTKKPILSQRRKHS